ncbi:unnamed protein product [Ambrosiozyma monospora]|uniref:Unnamed protein product n=1 Tax=Ambrosiozyma monospora TaxID=43982 RepID=A0ACB5SUD9_AMBMO|nr:unnamed protein product [Ambrosiozyma monospora]
MAIPDRSFDFSACNHRGQRNPTKTEDHLPEGCKILKVPDSEDDADLDRVFPSVPHGTVKLHLCLIMMNTFLIKDLSINDPIPYLFAPEPGFGAESGQSWISNSNLGGDEELTKTLMTSIKIQQVWKCFQILFFVPCEQELKQYSKVANKVTEGGCFVFTFLQFAKLFPFLPTMKKDPPNTRWYQKAAKHYQGMIHVDNFICSTQFDSDSVTDETMRRIKSQRSTTKKTSKCPVTYRVVVDLLHKVVFLRTNGEHSVGCSELRTEACHPVLRKLAVHFKTRDQTPQEIKQDIQDKYSPVCQPILEKMGLLCINGQKLSNWCNQYGSG